MVRPSLDQTSAGQALHPVALWSSAEACAVMTDDAPKGLSSPNPTAWLYYLLAGFLGVSTEASVCLTTSHRFWELQMDEGQ